MAAFAPTYSAPTAAYVRIESNTGPTTGTTGTATYFSNDPPQWAPRSFAVTTIAIEVPLHPEALALRKAIARYPRSRAGRLCSVARDGRIAYAACWNRQESTPPARSFEAATTYKARVMAELKRIRAKRI